MALAAAAELDAWAFSTLSVKTSDDMGGSVATRRFKLYRL